MVNVSTAWLRALANDQRDYQITISMTLANGVSLTIRNQNIWQGSFGIDDAVSADNDFQIGAAIINKCNFSLNNMYGDFDTFDFLNARLNVSVGLMVEGSLETIRKGSFVIVNNPTYNGALINIEAYDYMYFFDVPYSQNNTVYPTTADVIVRDMCTDLGVPLNTYDFPNKNTTISERPTEEATTYREVLSYVCQICGCYARCNVYGQLELKWYDQDALDSPTYAYDGGSFDADTPYATGDAVNGGVFNPWETGDVAEGGAFSWNSSVHFISSVYSRDISTEDVVITGIRILVKTKENDSSEETIKEFLKGTTGYVIEISENPFINISNADAIATRLATQLVGFKFRKANISHGSDPSIEAGDVAFVFDRKQNVYPIVISHTIFKNGSEQQTYSAAQDVYKNVAARYSAETKNYVDLRRRIKNERTSREEVEAALRRSIASASGLHETEIVDESSGATLRYLHNKPELAESDIQILVSDVGITVTADSGEHWYGLRVNGDLIARILTATGVNADWINTGQLVIRDQQGNVTFYADTETGTVRIVASEFSLTGGSTIQSIANQAKSEAITSSNAYADTKSTQALNSAKAYSDKKLGDYKDEVSAIIDGIQDQLDGAIETWYYDYQPTLNNYPASDWTTETDRKTHEGDLFYWKSTGYSYRFLKNDTTGNWEWQIVQDTGISTAIAKAEAAQDTADHKRRVFITQPIPPYDKGDLWAQGENGDLMRCVTARASGTYVASDWTKASRYTDDSALNIFVNNTYLSAISSIQGQLDKKVDTYYQESDPSVNWTSAELSEHVGDMWFNSSSLVQKYYRWNGSSWSELTATPPAEVFNQIDGKAQIFVSTPTTPYNVGDLWFNSTTSDIMTCVTARATGDYVATDWQKRNKYTDDSALNSWIKGEFASTLDNVRGQIDKKADTWYKDDNPALDWDTIELKKEHISDLWYCSASSGIYAQKYWRYSEDYEWQEITADVPDEVFDTINNKAQIFVGSTNPVPPYNVGDLWFNATQDGTGDIYTCVTSRAKDSAYSSSDWAIRNKYTDDSVAKAKYGTCATNADVQAKVVKLPGFKLFDGAMITVFFSHSNTAENPTLNVNGTGAMPIWVKGTAITSAHYWRYTDVVDFVYSEGSESHWEAMIESQEEIFNRLTNYGQIRGIYMQDGQLYVNATYILSGTMSANLVRGGTFAVGGSTKTTSQGKNGIIDVFNSDDERIVRIDANGIRVGNIVDALSEPNTHIRTDGYLETNRFRAIGYVRIAGTSDTSYKSYLKIPIVNGYEVASDDCYFEVGENGTTIKTRCMMPINTEGSVLTEAGATLKAGGILQRQLYNGYGQESLVGGYVCACTDTLTTDYINDYVQITPFRIQLFNKQRSSSRVSIDSNQMLVMNSNGQIKVDINLTDGIWTHLGARFGRRVNIASNLYVSGDKHRLVETEDYGKRVLYCYETASPTFGDIGEGVIGEDGKCYISIDAILAETINSSEYQVFLQKYGNGDCYVSERKSGYFVVSGTPGMSFGWEFKAKQYDAMQKRLENTDLVKTPSEISNQVDYANQAEIHINQILNERIPQDEGSNVSDTL